MPKERNKWRCSIQENSWWTLDSRDETRRAESQKHLPVRSWAERVDRNTHK